LLFTNRDSQQVEYETIIYCLALSKDNAALQKLRDALVTVTDWGPLFKTALNHGAFPSLYRQIADTCLEAVPPDVQAEWSRLYKIYAQRNLRATTELIQVLSLFESRGIIAIPGGRI